MTKWFGTRAGLLKLAVLAFVPFGLSAAYASDQLNQIDPRAGFTSVSKAYHDMDAHYIRSGTPRELTQVRGIAVGQSQAALQAVLGRPAHRNSDGSFEFHLSLPLTRRDRVVCQYRVFFDGARKVSRAVWRRPQCADLVAGKQN